MPRMQNKNSAIYRYMKQQELHFISSSTDQFTSYSYENSNKAKSTTKCSWFPIRKYIFTFL